MENSDDWSRAGIYLPAIGRRVYIGPLIPAGMATRSASPAQRRRIGGQTGSLGSFGGAQPITMVTRSGGPRAVPSAITGGSAFSVNWQHG